MKTTSFNYANSVLLYVASKYQSPSELPALLTVEKNTRINDRISMANYETLVNQSALLLEDSLFGFNLGKAINVGDYGVLGYLVETCQDLSQAIEVVLKYDTLVADIGQTSFETDEEFAKVAWHCFAEQQKHLILRNMTAWVATVRHVLANDLAPLVIEFVFPLSVKELQTLSLWFNCPVRCNQKENILIFPKHYLHLPFKTSNTNLFLTLKHASDDALNHHQNDNLLNEINYMLKASAHLKNAKQKDIAKAFNITTRTLQRKLKHFNTNYSALLDKARQERALQLINTHSLSEITDILGFSEQATLTKAFHKWFNCSPLAYRKKLNQ